MDKAYLLDQLREKDLRASPQRIKVLEYLFENKDHPTVDQIYKDIVCEMPSLSRTTIYNTLSVFVEAGLVRVITIEGNETRYDIITKKHGHFKCSSCQVIYDFDIDLLPGKGLEGFRIDDENVYFKGVCNRCLKNKRLQGA